MIDDACADNEDWIASTSTWVISPAFEALIALISIPSVAEANDEIAASDDEAIDEISIDDKVDCEAEIPAEDEKNESSAEVTFDELAVETFEYEIEFDAITEEFLNDKELVTEDA